ncbi:hypothetical protein BCR35DRAFT_354254 [Leucosporidium creatinivorum]|uniref:RING-CH-type domain-containing protein n=1 Tax=Leucosporidium creatinivorum TaxID=106004 RepID=A0A1Y2ENM0_9BASI|nr:hypothetical protein BCR35DRAFT_354254 [Leucosporidium creatinivorum]
MSHATASTPQYARAAASTSTSSSPYPQTVEEDDELPALLDAEESPTRAVSPPPYSSTASPRPLAPSPSTSELPAQQATRSRPRSPPQRTVSTLKDKSCWICMGTELEDEPGSEKKWVHACSCTLVAHEECLLAWYLTSSTTQPTPSCPVCATPYTITQSTSPLLTFYKRSVRRWDKAATVIAIGGVLGGGWLVASAYGAYAVRAWAGEEVARVLLWGAQGDGGKRWKYWLNLPLIPLTLLLSRTPLIDSLLPFLPLTLVLSLSPPHPLHSSPLILPPLTSPTDSLSSLSFTFPPSPTLTLCLLPWARHAYLRARRAIFRKVLGQGSGGEGWRGVLQGLQGVDELADEAQGEGGMQAGVGAGQLELGVELELEEEEAGEGAAPNAAADQQQQQQQAHQPAANPRPAMPPAQRLRLGLSRLTSLIVGALLYPTLCSLSGSALLWLASRGGARPSSGAIRALRKVLGVSALLAAPTAAAAPSTAMSWLRLVTSTPLRLGGTGGGSEPIDPVWLRTSLGGAILLLMRDGLELGAGVLEMRRRKSRRVVGRELGDLQWEEGREEEPRVEGAEGDEWSGGRDETGREARVNVGAF